MEEKNENQGKPVEETNENQETNDAEDQDISSEEKPQDEKQEPSKEEILKSLRDLSDDDLLQLHQQAKDSDVYKDGLLRNQADYENYRKRMERERSNIYRYANQDILKSLLAVLDHLMRAIESGKKEQVDQNFLEGICIVEKEFTKLLENYEAKEIEAKGKPFDPNFHEALSQIETDEHPEMTVVEEFEKGYSYHDRILRPSKVIISKAVTKKEEPTESESEEDKDSE